MPVRGHITEMLGPYTFTHGGGAFALTQDPFLLADFIPAPGDGDPVIDLGTGSGIIPLLLAWKSRCRHITGVEIEKDAAALAASNVSANRLGGRITVLEKDYRSLCSDYREGAFKAVVSNPPYVAAGSGRLSPDRQRMTARSEIHGRLRDLIEVSAYLAGSHGRLYYVFTVRRLSEMTRELERVGFFPLRLRFIHPAQNKDARIFLIEAGRRGLLKVEPPIVLKAAR